MDKLPPKFSIDWPPRFESRVDRQHLADARRSQRSSRALSGFTSQRGNPLAAITPAKKD